MSSCCGKNPPMYQSTTDSTGFPVFNSFDEAVEFQKDVNKRTTRFVMEGCDWVMWDGSHGEVGFAHMGICRNEIHKCECK